MKRVKLRDRVDGSFTPIDGGSPLLESRWIVEERIVVNGHTTLEFDDLVLDDGAPHLRLGVAETGFVRARLSKSDLNNYRVALDAVAAIDTKTNLFERHWPSPLLPAELGEESKPTELDTCLDEVFERGHLDAIATRPRLTMRYDTELLPVDRARRLDTGFQRHLAAHSECWAARSISGVVPKSVLGRVSEDDADIYEHRVYARLLDHLERYLLERIGKLASIGNRYEKGLEFSNSQEVDYRLRRDICAVWGEAVSEGDAGDVLKLNREQTRRLERFLKRVKALKGQRIKGFGGKSLYDEIPRGAQVGFSLIATNLLQHDAHYRQLNRLWRAWLAVSSAERERPVQVLERRRNEQERYERYVGLVALRALKTLGFTISWPDGYEARAEDNVWDQSVLISFRRHDWCLELDGQRLVLIPVSAPLDAETSGQWTTVSSADGSELRVPCALHKPQSGETISPSEHLIHGTSGLLLSPMDLYAEEAMTTLILAWLWKHRIRGYGEVFPRLPNAVADAWPFNGKTHGTDRALLAPVDSADWQRLWEVLLQHANEQIREKILCRKRQLDNLSRCPICAQGPPFFNPLSGGFFAQCQCGCTWELRDRRFVIKGNSEAGLDFSSMGHRLLSVGI
jgi:hypothetical protein